MSEHRAQRLRHWRAVFRVYQPAARKAADLHVGGGEDCNDTRCGAGIAGVDVSDLGMRVRTSQNVSIELTWTVNVVRVAAGAGEEAKILFAPHRSADALIFHGPSPPFTQRYHGRLVPLSVFRLEAHCGQR